jgi:RHS repeat-associated protein
MKQAYFFITFFVSLFCSHLHVAARQMNISQVPTSFAIDKTKDVGSIPFSQNTANGAMSYSVPIEAYQAANGFSPSIQLSYNSMAGNGVAGYGWQIAGLSAISIANKNVYFDSFPSAATGDINGAFVLDGMRLIRVASSSSLVNPIAGTIAYQTEQGFIQVLAYLNTDNLTVKYFQAFYPNGNIATYGYTSNTSMQATYPLTQMTDILGNVINYSYTFQNNIYYVNEIDYGGNVGVSTMNNYARVTFSYGGTSDATVYMAGLAITPSLRLATINTYFGSQLLRTYSLTYSYSDNNSSNTTAQQLTQLDCTSGGHSLNPLLFYYGEYTADHVVKPTTKGDITIASHKSLFGNAIFKGKFHLNSSADGLVSYAPPLPYCPKIPAGSGFGSILPDDKSLNVYDMPDPSSGITSCNPASINMGSDDTGDFLFFMPMDVNGDGKDELVSAYTKISGSNEIVTFHVYGVVTTNGQSKIVPLYTFPITFDGVFSLGGGWNGMPCSRAKRFLMGDFLGTGRQTILAITYNSNPLVENGVLTNYSSCTSQMTLIDLQNQCVSPLCVKTACPFPQSPYDGVFQGQSGASDPADHILSVIDFDGDGKADLCLIDGAGTRIYSFNASGQMNLLAYYNQITIDTVEQRQWMFGDVNGDGKTDIVIGNLDASGSLWSTYFSTGTTSGFVKQDTHIPNLYLNNHNAISGGYLIRFTLQDINNDGKDDLVADVNGTISVYPSVCGQFSTLPLPQTASTTVTYPEFTQIYAPETPSFNQDDITSFNNAISNFTLVLTPPSTQQSGWVSVPATTGTLLMPGNVMHGKQAHQLYVINDDTITCVTFPQDVRKDNLLTGSVNSTGVVNQHLYANITDSTNNTYVPANVDYLYPYRTLNQNLYLLSETSSYLTGNKIAGTSFTYTGGVIDVRGKGFTGFSQVTAHDELRNTTATQTFDPFNFGVSKSVDSPTLSASYTSNINTDSNHFTLITLTGKTETSKLTNATITTSISYDTYGNPLHSTVDYGNGTTTTTDNLYNNLTGGNIFRLGELSGQTTTNQRGGQTATAAKSITYDPSTRLPLTLIQRVNGNQVSQTAYTYTNGRPTQESVIAYGSSTALNTTYTYDNFGRIQRQTDPLGLFVTSTYDGNRGLIASITDHKGNITSYGYDTWGNKITTSYPDGTVESVSPQWVSSSDPSGGQALYMATVTKTGAPSAQSYSDALGRDVCSGVMRFDGNYLYTVTQYDILGRVQRTSLPFKVGPPALWNTVTYDAYDRPLTLSYASGKQDTYSYSGLSATSTINGITKTTTKDAAGQILTITDPAGTIAYNLRPDGQPSSIVAPGGITTNFGYDTYGRRTSLADPSAGTYTYTYDQSGNLNSQTDALGKVTTSTFDAYHRVTQKQIAGEFSTAYTYNADGLPTGVTSTNSTSQSYTYDNLLRVATETESVPDGKSLQKTYSYANGNVTAIAYATADGTIATVNNLYANGNPAEVKLNNSTSIWKVTAENNMGIVSAAATGPLTREYGFDNYGLPTARTVKCASATLQDFSYNIDPATDNLNWRSDNTRSLRENFTCDNLNRLATFDKVTSIGNLLQTSGWTTMSYDAKGNITGNSALGNFAYGNTAKPYAVTRVVPCGSAIPVRDQDITYNGLLRPATISENGYNATFAYDTNGDRVKMLITQNGTPTLTRYYIGGQYELDKETGTERLYMDGDAYSAASVYVKESGAWKIYYICRDYQGSITHLANTDGTLKQELSYDPWGRPRNPATQTAYAPDAVPDMVLGRGYTGHEHLNMFGLINMNARLYNPALGRFLSPDPYVQAPDFSQSFNRYSYCLNNPLKYTDINGKWADGPGGTDFPSYTINDPNGLNAPLAQLWYGGAPLTSIDVTEQDSDPIKSRGFNTSVTAAGGGNITTEIDAMSELFNLLTKATKNMQYIKDRTQCGTYTYVAIATLLGLQIDKDKLKTPMKSIPSVSDNLYLTDHSDLENIQSPDNQMIAPDLTHQQVENIMQQQKKGAIAIVEVFPFDKNGNAVLDKDGLHNGHYLCIANLVGVDKPSYIDCTAFSDNGWKIIPWISTPHICNNDTFIRELKKNYFDEKDVDHLNFNMIPVNFTFSK